MLVLLALAASPRPALEAKATVRIERPAKVGREAWEKLPPNSKREVIVRGEQGQRVLLRLIENQ